MKKTLSLLAVITALGAAISSYSWALPAINTVRDYMVQPAIVEIQRQTTLMASMKHYDIQTDNLEKDVKALQEKIQEAEQYIEQHFNQPLMTDQDTGHKFFIQQQMDKDRQQLREKMEMLDRANKEDLQLLAILAAS
jgi:vacuolar-type H+-ATPase subunit I/STV1